MLTNSKKTVCFECAGKSLGRYIKLHGTENHCSYCSKKSDNIAVEIYGLKEKIIQSWNIFYEIVNDSFSYDPRTKFESFDMIFTESDTELDDANGDFKSDLSQILANYIWIKKSDYWEELPESLMIDWKKFCEIVKRKWRYTFFLTDINEKTSSLTTLSVISEFLKSLVIPLECNSIFFRGRGFKNLTDSIFAKDLGSAPCDKAKESRFSPIGISFFYGSEESETAKIEADIKQGEIPVIGKFFNIKPIKVLDLTNIPKLPFLYDDNNELIPTLQFLQEFSAEISKPIGNNSNYEKLDYIPTQIFTEYIRRIGLKKYGIRGIKYKSSKVNNTNNFVLFYTNEQCLNKKDDVSDKDCLVLESFETQM